MTNCTEFLFERIPLDLILILAQPFMVPENRLLMTGLFGLGWLLSGWAGCCVVCAVSASLGYWHGCATSLFSVGGLAVLLGALRATIRVCFLFLATEVEAGTYTAFTVYVIRQYHGVMLADVWLLILLSTMAWLAGASFASRTKERTLSFPVTAQYCGFGLMVGFSIFSFMAADYWSRRESVLDVVAFRSWEEVAEYLSTVDTLNALEYAVGPPRPRTQDGVAPWPAYPLETAIRRGDPEIVRLLLRSGASLYPETLPVVHGGSVRAVLETRLMGQASSRRPLREGLHTCAYRGDTDIISVLLEYGAEPQKRDGRGRLAADIAEVEGHNRAARVLRGAS